MQRHDALPQQLLQLQQLLQQLLTRRTMTQTRSPTRQQQRQSTRSEPWMPQLHSQSSQPLLLATESDHGGLLLPLRLRLRQPLLQRLLQLLHLHLPVGVAEAQQRRHTQVAGSIKHLASCSQVKLRQTPSLQSTSPRLSCPAPAPALRAATVSNSGNAPNAP